MLNKKQRRLANQAESTSQKIPKKPFEKLMNALHGPEQAARVARAFRQWCFWILEKS
jgi:hypothetical protein